MPKFLNGQPLTGLQLSKFRNFFNLQLTFNQLVTLVVGENGSGKSNLLEAIYYLATGFSSRTTKSYESIQWTQKLARIEGNINGRKLVVVLQRSGKQLFIEEKQKTLKDFLRNLQVVLFQPQDMSLLNGSPGVRRRFLNQLIGTLDFEYLYMLGEYKKILSHRNKLLSLPSPGLTELSIWTDQLAFIGTSLQEKREKTITEINSFLNPKGLAIVYRPSPRDDTLAEKLLQLQEREKLLGFTLVGPQRDDFKLFQSSPRPEGSREGLVDLGVYGSRGQQRMGITQLKLAQLNLVEAKTEVRPLLLLDDIFSELDEKHRHEILEVVRSQQTIITSTHVDDPILKELEENDTQVVRL